MAAPASSYSLAFLSKVWRLFLAFALTLVAAQASPKWSPISKEELADSKPKVDPDAGAEILFREVVMDHAASSWWVDSYYVRAKIYSQRGIDDLAKIEINYATDAYVSNIAARTIKPDGTVVELDQKDIFDREIVKYGAERWHIKSFALPGLEPGAMVEYRYTIKDHDPGYFTRVFFQTELPAQHVRFKVLIAHWGATHATSFNCRDQPLECGDDGYFTFEMNNLTAMKEEAFSPPKINTIAAMLIYPSGYSRNDPKEFWQQTSLSLHAELDLSARPTKAIRTTLTKIVSPNDTPATKIAKIHDFCRSKIINYAQDKAAAKKREPKDPDDRITAAVTLKTGAGDPEDINSLFAALARAAGLEADYISCADRSVLHFRPDITEPFIIPKQAVAVSIDGKWQYFDPGAYYLPAGTLPWRNTDTTALIGDAKGSGELRFITGTPTESNTRYRKAELTLDEDGTLEGDVTESYTGLCEAELKESYADETSAKREEIIREAIQKHQSMAELTAIKIENADDPIAPLHITYHLRIPNYADRTDSRLFVQPAVFQKGKPPLFENITRRTDLLFHYRFEEKDEVRIAIPDDYRFEQPSAPGSYDLGEFGRYENQISIVAKARALVSVRTYRQTCVAVAKSFYPMLVSAAQSINKRDNHTLTLQRRVIDATPSERTAAPAANAQAH